MNLLWLLAQAAAPAREEGPRWVWPDRSTLPLKPLLWAATILVGLIVAVWAGRLAIRWWRRLEPIRVFWGLGGRLGLSHAQRWWLWQVARRSELRSPITLLVCDSTLRVHAEVAYGPHGGRHARRVEEVVRRLHGPGAATA